MALLNASKEGNYENQADRFDAELLLPIQLNMEKHRYVLESPTGPLMISPTNCTEEGTTRSYQDHYKCKKYTLAGSEEKAASVVDIDAQSEKPHADIIKALGESLGSSLSQAGKRDSHFFSKKTSPSNQERKHDRIRVCFSVSSGFKWR